MEMMETEIELKYLIVDEQVVEKITNLLDAKKYHYEFEKNELKNCYFDTKELELRKHDCGLRVRSKNGQREQTIKMSGQALAGLHKRPEYNVNIDNNTPVLSLFPKDIWPENIQLVEWQNNLMALFTTDFVRHMWTIQYQDSVIELAFDKGCISSSDRQVDICEIELELKSGIEYDLFSLAHQLMTVLLMRPGVYSKAARGYQLWHNIGPNLAIEDFPFIPALGKDTCPSAFINGVTFCLTHLQKTIDVYFHQPSLHVLGQLNHTLQLLRHAFWLFEDFMTDDMIVIRKEISYFIKMFVWENNAKNLQELLVQSNSYPKQIEYNQKLIAQLKLEELRFPTVEHILELLQ